MSVERQAANALKWSAISRAVSQAIAWAVTLIVIRLLSPDDYGLMAIVTVIIAILGSIAELGLGASIVQTKSVSRSELENLAGATWALNLSLASLIVLSAPLAGQFFDDPRLVDVVRVSALHFVFNAAATVPQSLAYREMRFKRLSAIELVSMLVNSASTVALAWFGAEVWALVLGSLAGALCRTAMLMISSEAVRPRLALQGVTQHLTFGGKVTVSRLLWQIVYQLDVVIAGRLLTKDAVGVYSVSLHFATLPMQKIMSVLNQVVFPTVARLQDEPLRLRSRLLDGSRLLMFAAIPALWGMSAVSPELVLVALGDKWLDAVFPLQVVTLIVPLRMLSAILTSSVSAMGKPEVELHNTLFSAIVLPTCFFVGAQWGVNGLALSWLAGIPLVFIVNFPRIARILGLTVREASASLYGPIVAGLLMYFAVYLTRLALDSVPALYRLVALILVGAAIYVTSATAFDRQIVTNLKRLAAAFRT